MYNSALDTENRRKDKSRGYNVKFPQMHNNQLILC